ADGVDERGHAVRLLGERRHVLAGWTHLGAHTRPAERGAEFFQAGLGQAVPRGGLYQQDREIGVHSRIFSRPAGRTAPGSRTSPAGCSSRRARWTPAIMQRTEPPASSMAPTSTGTGVAEASMTRSWDSSSARIARADRASRRPLLPVSSIALPATSRI